MPIASPSFWTRARRAALSSAVLVPLAWAFSPAFAEQLKPALNGLAAMGSPAFHHQKNNGIPDNLRDIAALPPGVFDAAVINVTWAQLEPARNVLATRPIDEVLAAVRAYNAQYRDTPLALRLRVWGGVDAPQWAKSIGGAPITVRQRELTSTVGRFWSDPYREAWRQLQADLARRYDSEPLIREVTVTSCASISSEPFILPPDPDSIEALRSAGLTDRAYQSCLMDAPRDYAPWLRTRAEYPINPYRGVDSGQVAIDADFSLEVMHAWRQRMGERGVISNYDLKSPPAPRIAPIFQEMARMGGRIEFQMFAPKNLDLEASVAYGLSMGAGVIELWSTVIPGIPPETLQQWSRQLKEHRR